MKKLSWLYKHHVNKYLERLRPAARVEETEHEIFGYTDTKIFHFFWNGETPVFECKDAKNTDMLIFQFQVPEEPHRFSSMIKNLNK